MKWIELTLKPHSDDKKTPRKVMQRIDQIGDIYINHDGYTIISPIYMNGNDYPVMESYEEIQRVLSQFEEEVFTIPTKQEREEELSMLKKWMGEHGYEFNS